MGNEQARTAVERAKAAVGRACFASITPRQLRLTQGDWLIVGSIRSAGAERHEPRTSPTYWARSLSATHLWLRVRIDPRLRGRVDP